MTKFVVKIFFHCYIISVRNGIFNYVSNKAEYINIFDETWK